MEENNAENVEQLKSQHSIRPSFVRFVNCTPRTVDCIWINYEGRRIKYKTLHEKQYFDVCTFVSHPWIFRDSKTHDKMCVSSLENRQQKAQRKDVFMPPDVIENGIFQKKRKIILITLPIYSLKERCFQFLRENLTCDISKLEIPLTIKQDYNVWLKGE